MDGPNASADQVYPLCRLLNEKSCFYFLPFALFFARVLFVSADRNAIDFPNVLGPAFPKLSYVYQVYHFCPKPSDFSFTFLLHFFYPRFFLFFPYVSSIFPPISLSKRPFSVQTAQLLAANVINELRLLQHLIQVDAPRTFQEVGAHHGAQHVAPVTGGRHGRLRQQQMDHLHDASDFPRRMLQVLHFFDLLVADIGQGVQLSILSRVM